MKMIDFWAAVMYIYNIPMVVVWAKCAFFGFSSPYKARCPRNIYYFGLLLCAGRRIGAGDIKEGVKRHAAVRKLIIRLPQPP